MRPAILAILLASCVHAQQLSFQGTVVDAVSHQPMAGVHIILRPSDSQKMPAGTIFGAISTREGKFSIQSLAPGTYHLEAKCNGYILIPAKTPDGSYNNIIQLKAGEDARDLLVTMTQHAVVTGRVLDENGDPVPRVPVAIQRDARSEAQTDTDDRGQYRVALPPGRYYIDAMAQNSGRIQNMGGLREIRNDGASPRVFGDTFYPSSHTKDGATPLDLGPGQHADGIDIHLTSLVSVTITGKVSGLPEGRGNFPRAFVSLSPAPDSGQTGSFISSAPAQVGPNGEFTFEGVAPGRYLISARSMDGGTRSAVMEVAVQSSDVTNLSMALSHGETLEGTIQMEGGKPQSTDTEKLSVVLESVPRRGEDIRADADGEGAFHIQGVFPGKFKVRVAPLPENAYLKSVKVGAVESEGTIDLTSGMSGVHLGIVIDRNGGQVEGAVLNKDGQPSELPFPLVALAAAGGEPDIQQPAPGTKFSYTGLRPGKYRLIAVDPGQLEGNAEETVKALLSKAPEIEVLKNARISKDLRISDTAASDAK